MGGFEFGLGVIKQRSRSVCLRKQEALEQIGRRFLKRLEKRVAFAWGTVYLLDREDGCLRPLVREGDELDFIHGFSFPMGNGLSAWIVEQQKPVALRNIHHGRRHRHHPVRAFASFPIVVEGISLGAVTLGHTDPHAFSEEECEYVKRAASRLGRSLLPMVHLPL